MASHDLNIGPAGAIAPVSRALARITPALPQARPPAVDGAAPEVATAPLLRSGVGVRELLTAADELIVRSPTPALVLGLGLEQARGALLRNQPADALAALNRVWDGARNTETGWYLRGSSLTLLGHPEEAARVAGQGLDLRPDSVANHYLQSLAKLTLGDAAGARTALANATSRQPADVLLLVQSALLAARQGNGRDAELLLRQAGSLAPDHPALDYGRSALRQFQRDGAGAPREPGFPAFAGRAAGAGMRTPPFTMATPGAMPAGGRIPTAPGDIVTDAFLRLGARLAAQPADELLADCRGLLTGLSAGGTLAAAVSPPRSFAARTLLGAIVDALRPAGAAPRDGWEAESVNGKWQPTRGVAGGNEPVPDLLRTTVRALVRNLRDDRMPEAELQLRKAPGALGETALELLRVLVGGEHAADRHRHATDAGWLIGGTEVRRPAPDDPQSLLVPLRLGLALLPGNESSVQDAARFAGLVPDADSAARRAAEGWGGWGAAGFAARAYDRTPRRTGRGLPNAGSGLVSIAGAFILAVTAILAFAAGHPLLTIACAGAAAWLGLRGASSAIAAYGGDDGPRDGRGQG